MFGSIPPPRSGCIALFLYLLVRFTFATIRYYGTYTSYGTGDTIIDTQFGHGGPKSAHRKWNIECLDGEAMVGVRDSNNDFQRIVNLWCKFIFPYKPGTSGMYPYYPNCHVRNLTVESFCFDPTQAALTVNTFMTGMYDDENSFRIDRTVADQTNTYKCCRTPAGYYIDYISCYYQLTHDQYWEYYDATIFLVKCSTGYVMTGLAKKINAWVPEYHLEWIQCCRVGFDMAMAGKNLPVVAPSNHRMQFSRYSDRYNNR